MRFKKLVAAAIAITGIATGAVFSPSASAATAVIKITVWNGTGAYIGLINPADGQHTTRSKAISVSPWGEVRDMWVPTDGTFVVIYAETCLKVPGSVGTFTFRDGRYNAQLSAIGLTPSLIFTQDKANPVNGVQVAQNVAASSCSGL